MAGTRLTPGTPGDLIVLREPDGRIFRMALVIAVDEHHTFPFTVMHIGRSTRYMCLIDRYAHLEGWEPA